MKLLILGSAILAADVKETGTEIIAADIVYPKQSISGYQIVDADVPNDFSSNDYEYLDGTIALKVPPIVLPPCEDYIAALDDLYNKTAQEKRFDSRFTCALRAGYPSAYQAQGLAFATWMDDCNVFGYGLMQQVENGEAPQPTIAEFLAMLPVLVWPE